MSFNFFLRLISALIIAPIIIFILYLNGKFFYLLLLIIFFLCLYETFKIKNFKINLFIIILLLLFMFSSYSIRNSNDGFLYLCYVLIVSWLSDTGGFFFGKFFQGPKLKSISPNKTYIGFIGSLIFSQFSIIYINYFDLFDQFNFFQKILLASTSSIAVIFGDLLFSYFKRIGKIKDYSKILPGHGGILDRIDGLIILTILYYFFGNLL